MANNQESLRDPVVFVQAGDFPYPTNGNSDFFDAEAVDPEHRGEVHSVLASDWGTKLRLQRDGGYPYVFAPDQVEEYIEQHSNGSKLTIPEALIGLRALQLQRQSKDK